MPGRRALSAVALALLVAAGPARARDAGAEVTPDLQTKINQAVERGAAWLSKQRREDGSFGALTINGNVAYPVGLTALCGYALVMSGVPKKDPGLQKTLLYVRSTDLLAGRAGSRSTYDAGLLLMFVAEMYRPEPKADKDKGRYAKPKEKDPCGLPADVHVWLADVAHWLVSVQMEDGWWRYPTNPPPDLSNTQYALLGLRAARDCGITVPATCFLKALENTLAAQQKDGPKVLRITKGSGKPGDRDYASDGGDKARGWAYQKDMAQTVTGSMTTAGIGALAICRDALMKPERHGGYTDEADRKVGRSVQDGFSWLDVNFSVEKNPPSGTPAWHYYYLYGLERACALANRENLGKHDWYAEGAAYLVARQAADGRWSTGALGTNGEVEASDFCDTAWALLFLKRATRPAVPILPPVVTTGG